MLDQELKAGQGLTQGMSASQIGYNDALENYRKNPDWWIVFDSFDLQNASGSALWISGRTGISLDTVTEALEGLVVLGLVTKSSKGFEKIKSEIHIPNEGQPKQKRFEEHSITSHQILSHLGENAKAALRVSSFASNIEIIAEMFSKIDQAVLEADEKSKKLSRDQIDNIYLTTFTSVTATQTQNGRGATHV